MGQYARLVARNDGDVDVLPELTDDAKSELGIASLGHGIRLFAAIDRASTAPASTSTTQGTSALRATVSSVPTPSAD